MNLHFHRRRRDNQDVRGLNQRGPRLRVRKGKLSHEMRSRRAPVLSCYVNQNDSTIPINVEALRLFAGVISPSTHDFARFSYNQHSPLGSVVPQFCIPMRGREIYPRLVFPTVESEIESTDSAFCWSGPFVLPELGQLEYHRLPPA